jgi:hypothetical protein
VAGGHAHRLRLDLRGHLQSKNVFVFFRRKCCF